jgi:hypothetical protein
MSNRDEPAGDRRGWLAALALLLGWQVWMTLGLFGGERPCEALLDDRPLLSGRHPLHLYHGFLGARSFLERGTLLCYDPAFHAGYPKTPVFDGGSRPAELALALAGARFHPAAYKGGLALLSVLAPLLLFAAARGIGLKRGPACLACALGLLVWWGRPCQDALAAGDVDLLLATLLVLAHAGFLIRYHRSPGLGGITGVVVTGLLGWFAHPLLLALLMPLFLIYYLSVGTRHRLPWHAPLLAGVLAAIAGNAFWLLDWISYSWIRIPLRLESPLLAHHTLRTFWEAPLWGGPIDKLLACGLAGSAGLGVLLYNGSCRATARFLGLAWGGFLLLAVLGIAWEPAGRLGASRLLIPALLYATLPATHGLVWVVVRLGRLARGAWGPAVTVGALLGAGWWWAPGPVATWAARLARPETLQVGLDPRQSDLVRALQQHTGAEARVLWEDQRGGPARSRWTALLPLLVPGRAFIGGLDPDAGIEHTAEGLVDQVLADRPLAEWTDAALADYCRRYNVGWVVCWSPGSAARFRRWDGADEVVSLPAADEGGAGTLFRLRRHPSFALTGSVRWQSADAGRILLSDAVPEYGGPRGDGEIVLSLHYAAGMRVSPGRVRLERALGPDDAIPFVRLRVSEPVGRVMITWEGR